MLARLRKIADLQRTRRLTADHYYRTEGNMHVTFMKRPSADTIDSIRNMMKVAQEHINKMDALQKKADT